MQSPDFARAGPQQLEQRDLLFLFEHFPVAGVDAVEAARQVIAQPSTLESLLESRYVYNAMIDQHHAWLDVSPKLFFNVMLRHALPGRREPQERRTIHYLANLLGLFVNADRLHRVQSGEGRDYDYLIDLVQEAREADHQRRFLVLSHIGNYALFLAGYCRQWIEHRHRYFHRPLKLDYYCNMSRSHYASAAKHELADTFGLKPVFAQLALRFDYYRDGLERMAAGTVH
ncbi:MAG: hypothetical protein NVS9B10_14660 [Nevskia sp.]